MEAVEARAEARRARGSPKDDARAKAKSKAKVEDAEAVTGSIRTRTRTGLEEIPTLHPGGSALSFLEGSKTGGLQPVPRCRRNKDKELSVTMKMWTGPTP